MTQASEDDRQEAVKSAFCRALELPESERAAFLEEALADPADRAEVQRLLEAFHEDYLAAPALEEEDRHAVAPELDALQQDHFDRYTIVRELGRGGMGTVYLARRRDELAGYPVALKVITPGPDSADLDARLRVEIQVLARLKHPNIVSVLDAGVSDPGRRVFLSMEYVDGVALDVYCRRSNLNARDRLELFLRICDAVAYAHRNLIIHRDLKPSNILVTAGGDPKLVDFGLAKILGEDSAETMTTVGRWRISLRYASPEQIQGAPLTTATDVYSLGVVLYELLTGASPYDADSDPVNLMHAVLSQEPIRPRSLAEGGLDSDLEAIVLKALRKEPQARYTSVDDLARDIGNYLRGLPVAARHGNAAYVARKFLRRHAVWLGVGLVVLVLGGAALASWNEARRSREEYARAVQSAEDAATWLNGASAAEHRAPIVAQTHRLAGLLFAHVQRRESDREAQVSLLELLTTLGDSLGHPAEEVNLGDTGGAVQILREVVGDAGKLYARFPDDLRVTSMVVRANRSLGSLLVEENDYAGAARLFERSQTIESGAMRRWPGDPVWLNDYADSLANLARVRLHEGNATECLRLGRESIEFRRKAENAASGSAFYRKDVGHALSSYCADLVELRRYPEALEACRESTAILATLTAAAPRRTVLRVIANNEEHNGRADAALGHRAAAIAHFEESVRRLRALEQEAPLDTAMRSHLARCLSRLAEALFQAGRRAAARAAAQEAVELATTAAVADPANAKARIALEQIRARTAAALAQPR